MLDRIVLRPRPRALPLSQFALLAALLTGHAVALAQDLGAPPPDPFQAQRAKEVLDENDRNAIRQWIDQRVAAISGEDAAAADQAVRDLSSNAASGSVAFKQAYVLAARQAVSRAYKQAKLVPAVRMLAALNKINDPELAPVFVEALSDERPPIRCEAAVALRNLRSKLTAVGGGMVGTALSALRDAAMKESSRPTLVSMYQAMNFGELPNPPDPQGALDALLSVLSSRAEQYASGNVRAYGADTAGLRAVGALRTRLGASQRDQFAGILGKMMRHAVRLYTAAPKNDETGVQLPPGTPRDETELLIREAEEQLAALLSPPADQRPRVTNEMEQLNQVRMKTQFNEWGKLLESATGQKFSLDTGEAATQPAEGAGGP